MAHTILKSWLLSQICEYILAIQIKITCNMTTNMTFLSGLSKTWLNLVYRVMGCYASDNFQYK